MWENLYTDISVYAINSINGWVNFQYRWLVKSFDTKVFQQEKFYLTHSKRNTFFDKVVESQQNGFKDSIVMFTVSYCILKPL